MLYAFQHTQGGGRAIKIKRNAVRMSDKPVPQQTSVSEPTEKASDYTATTAAPVTEEVKDASTQPSSTQQPDASQS